MQITLKPGEYLTDIRGYFNLYNGANIIRSLSFRTNKGPRSTVGEEEGTRFATTGNGKIVGCFGTADGDFLYSIGVYVHS